MFDSTRLPNLDEAVLRVLSVLANVADMAEPRKHIFDVKSLTFKPKTKIKLRKTKRNKINFSKVSLVGLFFSWLGLLILSLAVAKHHQKIVSPWLDVVVALLFIFLITAIISSISLLTLIFIDARESGKYSAQKMLNKAIEDANAYQPVISAVCTIVNGDRQKLKFAESIIKNLIIEETQARGKIISNLLPLLAPVIVLIIWLAFPIELPGNTSLYNTTIAIVGLGTLTLPIWKFITELQTESLVLKFKKCLFLLEQAQNMANNNSQQVIPVTSTKPRPKFGSAKGLIEMSDDFDAPLADFNEYMP